MFPLLTVTVFILLQVERERNLLNSKLVEFDSLLRSPYKGSSNSAIGLQSPFPISARNTSVSAQNSNPPSFSSFSQLGTSLGGGYESRFISYSNLV